MGNLFNDRGLTYLVCERPVLAKRTAKWVITQNSAIRCRKRAT